MNAKELTAWIKIRSLTLDVMMLNRMLKSGGMLQDEGNANSGNWGHAGRTGEVGGSAPSKGGGGGGEKKVGGKGEPIEKDATVKVGINRNGKYVKEKRGTIKMTPAPKEKARVTLMPRMAGFEDGKNVNDSYEIQILEDGNIAISNRDNKAEVIRRVRIEVDDEIGRLGGEMVEGEYWRSTDNPNEIELIKSGEIRRSKNHRTGIFEDGLSVHPRAEYYGFHKYMYKVKGGAVGVGSDKEPVLDVSTLEVVEDIRPYGQWARDLKKMRSAGQKKFKSLYGWTDEQIKSCGFIGNFIYEKAGREDIEP